MGVGEGCGWYVRGVGDPAELFYYMHLHAAEMAIFFLFRNA